ncbi:hypothetical protein ACQ4PT_045590 [Festuca glaucescens]
MHLHSEDEDEPVLDPFGSLQLPRMLHVDDDGCLRHPPLVPSASDTTPSEEEQGDEDEDAERGVEGEEDEYEEGERGEDIEEEEHQEGEEVPSSDVPGKAIWIRGPASLPDAPRTQDEKLRVATNGGQDIPDIQVWQTAHKKELVGGEVSYYGMTSQDLKEYTSVFKSLHGEDSDPLSQPLDETAVMISGKGREHGRIRILDAVHKPTTTLPRIRHTTSSSGVCMPPRPRCSTQTSVDARWEEAYEQIQAEFQQKMQEYEEAATAATQHDRLQTKLLFEAMRTGAPPPAYVEPLEVPPMPRMPTKQEFLAQLYGGTPVSALP